MGYLALFNCSQTYVQNINKTYRCSGTLEIVLAVEILYLS